jgi:hypothetical protein
LRFLAVGVKRELQPVRRMGQQVMKRFLLLILLASLSGSATAQGTVNFANASSTPGWPSPIADRHVKFNSWWYPVPVTGLNVSSNAFGVDLSGLRATLFYGVGTSYLLEMTEATMSARPTFKSSTSTTAGSWFSKTATLDLVPPGVTANLIVVVWDIRLSLDPRSAAAMSGVWGMSSPFQYTPPSSLTPAPSEFLMTGLQSFSIPWIPEPSGFALFAVGLGTLLMTRRRQ